MEAALLLAPLLVVLSRAGAAVAAEEPGRPQLTDEQKQKAKESFEKATRLYNLGKYGEAIDEYENAYLISADPVMLYNIAQCHKQNNQPEEAIRFYKNYLRNAPNASNRNDVEKRIAEMERLAEERRRTGAAPPPVTTAPPPVVTVSPTPPVTTPPSSVGQPPPPPTTPPPVTPDTTPTPSPQVGIGDTAPRPEEPHKRSKALPVTLLIASGAMIATSVVFGAIAAQKAKDVEKRADAHTKFDADAQKLEKDGKTASAIAVISGLAGAAVGVTGIVLLVRSGSSAEPAAATQAAVYPLAGPGLAGAGARFTF
jgi:tetratricopeptide (TPR) repeat protein